MAWSTFKFFFLKTLWNLPNHLYSKFNHGHMQNIRIQKSRTPQSLVYILSSIITNSHISFQFVWKFSMPHKHEKARTYKEHKNHSTFLITWSRKMYAFIRKPLLWSIIKEIHRIHSSSIQIKRNRQGSSSVFA